MAGKKQAKNTQTENKNNEAATVETSTKEAADKTVSSATVSKTEEKAAAVKEEPKEEAAPAKTEEKTTRTRGRKKGSIATKANTKPTGRKGSRKADKDSVEEVYIQYNGDEVPSHELVSRIKEAYKDEGHRIASIKSLQVYVHLNERKAYYVINGKAEGKYVEF